MAAVAIPRDRYTSAAFAALEGERMWPRVWQIACTIDHVSEPGDVFEYRCGRLSVLVVRGDDGQLRAFQNTCRHRGNAICEGSQQGLDELRCPFHKWTWDLAGNLREVPYRRLFGSLSNDALPLINVRVDTWGPLVFVNLDTGAPALDDYVAPMPADIAWVGIDDFRCVATVTTPVRANWKVICDGFSETYHVQGIHPELNVSMDDDIPQRVWDHVGCSQQDYGVPNPRLPSTPPDEAVWASFVQTQGARAGYDEKAPFPGLNGHATVADLLASGIRAVQAQHGVDLSGLSTQQLMRLNQYNLFPNATVLVQPDLLSVLAGRPGASPDDGEFVFFHFDRVPSGAARRRPVDVTMPAGQASLGFVLNQDFGVMESVQRGMHQPGVTDLIVSDFECRLINTHRNLDRYCGVESPASASTVLKDDRLQVL